MALKDVLETVRELTSNSSKITTAYLKLICNQRRDHSCLNRENFDKKSGLCLLHHSVPLFKLSAHQSIRNEHGNLLAVFVRQATGNALSFLSLRGGNICEILI